MGVAGGGAGVALLERGEELARIHQVISALRQGHGGMLIIEGAPGMGKTALLHAVCEQAAAAGIQTLMARASELERDFGFGVVRQLLETRLARASHAERTELLAGAAALAAPVLGLGNDGGSSDPFAVVHGLYWLVANLALDGPLVVAVDDLQWADEPSLRWLIYLCHRLEELPILVATTTRLPWAKHSPLLAQLIAAPEVQIVCPGPLSEPAVARLIHEGLQIEPDPAFVAACAELTGGNPFVLREFIRDVAADGVEPDAAHISGLAARVPARVERAILSRLGQLLPAALQLAHAIAVLGEGTELRLAAALAGVDIGTAGGAADALMTADLLAEGRPLRFVHPLVRSAIYEHLPPGARAQAHARAARLLIQEGAEAEHVAVQLLLCEPTGDPDTVHALRGAAAAALTRGAPETAITYLRRALTEPPSEAVRPALLGELGDAERIRRDPAAIVHLQRAWQATTDPVARARIGSQLVNVLSVAGQLERCLSVLQDGLDTISDHDPDLAARLYALKAGMGIFSARPPDPPEATIRRLRELAAGGTSAARPAQLILAAFLTFLGEDCREVAELVEQGWDDRRFLAAETSDAVSARLGISALVYTDELSRAHKLTEAMLADAQARGSVLGFATVSGLRGLIALRRGALADAEADTRASLELAMEHHLPPAISNQAATLGEALLERGKHDQAADVVEGVADDPTIIGVLIGIQLVHTRGRVRLARGQRQEGIADLCHCGKLAGDMHIYNPSYSAWRSTLALALAPQQPQEAWELAQEELQLARRAGTSRAIGIALRVCGLLASGEDGLGLLEQSVAVLEPTPMRLELAHSLTELGAALRRAGARVAAREPLRRALDLAARCGATPLATRARDEALAAGARPRRPSITGVQALTPSELRVARLASQSLSNRDIAQALFITTKTVNAHLSSVYRKLNIHTRDQLTTAMVTTTSAES